MGVPSVTKSSSVNPEHTYDASMSNSATLIFTGRGNLYGFLFEDNSGADTFIQFFDAASAGAVTLGTTTPDLTMKLPANSILAFPFFNELFT